MQVWVWFLSIGVWAGELSGAEPAIADTPMRIEIPVFSGGYGTVFYEESARLFGELWPGVEIFVHGDPRMHDKMRVRAIDGSLPDATSADLPWLNLVRAGKVVDLTQYLDGPNWEGDTRWRDTFLPGALETWTLDGRTYGLPLAQSAWTLFYDKGLFRSRGWEEPRTWDEFFALCERMKAGGVAPVALPGVYLRYGDAFLRAAFYSRAGAEAWRAYNALVPGARTDPRFVEAAEVFRRVTDGNLVPGWEGMTHTAAQLAFLQGRAGMVVSGSWFVNEMAGKFPEGFELGAMNFPVFADGVGEPTAIQGSNEFLFVFDRGEPKRERATVDFLRFLTSRDRATAFVRATDSPVAVRGIPEEAFSPRMRETAAMLARAQASFGAPPNMLQPPGMNQALTDARQALVDGRIDAAGFGARLEAAAEVARQRRAEGGERDVRVVPRDTWRGWALLAGVGAACVWIAVAVRRRLRFGTHREAGDEGGRNEWFGPLRARLAIGFVGPAVAIFVVIVLLPGLGSFLWALTDWDALGPRTWAGAKHFRWLVFESEVFWQALANNAFLMVVPALFVVPLALLFATLIQRGVAGAGLFRACFLFPNILGGVAATLIWLAAYDPANGFLNHALVETGRLMAAMTGDWFLPRWLLGFEHYAWLATGRLYWALIPIYVWLTTGFNLVLYLAAMQGIDRQLYEAAEIDGAGAVAQFFRITLPLIAEVIAISVVFLVIGGLNTFEMVWLLTAQDPTSQNQVLATWMVSTMFKEFDIGRATAIAVVMFVLVAAGSGIALLGLRKGGGAR
ncbi:extracellular solute-binding protein [Congregicoccus parvus]|uniref:extracellular solute-binding protein n=1 Tax=Congregicoccus parvus TaxID=3081749 RepID=UPI003FA5CC1E